MEPERIEYDETGDILYLWAEDPGEVDDIISEETGEEILIEKDGDTCDIIGITIMHLSKRSTDTTGIELPEATV